ncbi:MAG: peptide MFS transporter [Gemmataceae bacterium]|nr:peptide MFS transporter [Gemmataceae bacterium]
MATPVPGVERHPPGLAVLFLTEMWERFSFYSMLAMFTLYLQDPKEGFAWTKAEATALYANYLMFVYASPLVGGIIADWGLGYKRSVLIGGFFFMAGHGLLSFQDLTAVYAALTCLVIGNGFFKPNVSAMVGNLYPEGSPLKERAYNIFYMGINVGACAAPIVMEIVKQRFGFHAAFAVAAFGMAVSVATLWSFQRHVEDKPVQRKAAAPSAYDAIPEWQRIGALIVIFLVVIVFWMVFHQNGSTLTYWADENTNWKGWGLEVSGILSNSINGAWVVILTFPLVWFWGFLNRQGLEPSTPAKMALGMFLTAASFFLLWYAALLGEATATDPARYKFQVSPGWLIASYGIVTLGELMLSPMGLALVAKVAPERLRGIMMGGWFVATAIGNKLTMIGVYWEEWLHSTFFLVMAGLSLGMAFVLVALLYPLRKALVPPEAAPVPVAAPSPDHSIKPPPATDTWRT